MSCGASDKDIREHLSVFVTGVVLGVLGTILVILLILLVVK